MPLTSIRFLRILGFYIVVLDNHGALAMSFNFVVKSLQPLSLLPLLRQCMGEGVSWNATRSVVCSIWCILHYAYNFFFEAQVKTMRALQYFPTVEDPNTRRSLFEVYLLSRTYYQLR